MAVLSGLTGPQRPDGTSVLHAERVHGQGSDDGITGNK
jgi:hypothetical protein